MMIIRSMIVINKYNHTPELMMHNSESVDDTN